MSINRYRGHHRFHGSELFAADRPEDFSETKAKTRGRSGKNYWKYGGKLSLKVRT
jgi:hypothetical protein